MDSMKWIFINICLFVTSSTEESYNETSDSFIVGGNLTDISKHPHQVEITILGIRHHCGGSIISDNWIVTAAHCIDRGVQDLRVQSGSLYATKGEKHEFVEVIIHEEYSGLETLINDIAVARVSPNFIYSSNVQPIPLVNSEYNMADGTPVIITGWGYTEDGRPSEQLREVRLFSITNEYCQKLLEIHATITPCKFCAMVEGGGKDSCKGDSGGPAINDDGELVGVVSGGIGCALPKLPGYYSRVSCYREWIRRHTGV